jgi:hypothetical protein
MNKLEQEEKMLNNDPDVNRQPSPTTDIDNMVSDLNIFLSATHREIHTPKATRKIWGPNITKKDNLDLESFKMAGKTRNEAQNDNKMKKVYEKGVSLEVNSIQEKSNKITDNKKWTCAKCTLINPGIINY